MPDMQPVVSVITYSNGVVFNGMTYKTGLVTIHLETVRKAVHCLPMGMNGCVILPVRIAIEENEANFYTELNTVPSDINNTSADSTNPTTLLDVPLDDAPLPTTILGIRQDRAPSATTNTLDMEWLTTNDTTALDMEWLTTNDTTIFDMLSPFTSTWESPTDISLDDTTLPENFSNIEGELNASVNTACIWTPQENQAHPEEHIGALRTPPLTGRSVQELVTSV
ncbi:hypothetical protein BC936DRAFT_140710 [Jimgerdemannia flammicorona]|uniref:Uncharacterized protein n=1 Tax=Jimgerdemannia flammicorona TaxID=994334 RepID=A0A433AD78_9FUNG|nr:hypothetical protein BC936DRAFT_140710 [Jimgerdemannia flammicorona]